MNKPNSEQMLAMLKFFQQNMPEDALIQQIKHCIEELERRGRKVTFILDTNEQSPKKEGVGVSA